MIYYTAWFSKSDCTQKTAIVGEGTRVCHVCILAYPVRVIRIPLSEKTRLLDTLLYKGNPYPLNKALVRFRAHARGNGEGGITKAASNILRGAAAFDKKQRSTGAQR